jgi:hypothetical protein
MPFTFYGKRARNGALVLQLAAAFILIGLSKAAASCSTPRTSSSTKWAFHAGAWSQIV